MRSTLDALLPSGKYWEPIPGGDYDKLLDGIAANTESLKIELEKLAHLRDPDTTPILDDLEKEYGIQPSALATEEERRARLKAFRYRRTSTGAADILQEKLREAGFDDAYVHINSPAVDPNIFLAEAFNMVCGDLLPGGYHAQCGEHEAICAQVGGELVVNGDLYNSLPNYTGLCGNLIYCGDDIYCGDFDGYKSDIVQSTYIVPADSGYWPLIFFVGGAATRDPVTGALTEIEFYNIPSERRVEFRRVILKFKPLSTWGGLIVVYG
jgi:hypothetical protein